MEKLEMLVRGLGVGVDSRTRRPKNKKTSESSPRLLRKLFIQIIMPPRKRLLAENTNKGMIMFR